MRYPLQILLLFFFLFAPLYFVTHLFFNVFHIVNPTLFLFISLLLTGYFYKNCQSLFIEEIEAIPPTIQIILAILTLLLIAINFLVGIDDSGDAYFYHLNIAVPLALSHNVFDYSLYDLDSYSEGYPKFANFLQAIAIAWTGYFWGYGLISILIIPCSFIVVYKLARQLQFLPQQSAWIGLLYACNPINISQATTGYIDTIQSIYVLVLMMLACYPASLAVFSLFLLNIVVLVNIKFTGLLLGASLFGFYLLLNRDFLLKQWQKGLGLCVIAGGFAVLHYAHNWLTYGTLVFPFIDSAFAKVIADLYIVQEGYFARLLRLFWTVPQSLSVLAIYDTVHGAFSFLWYPLPLFILFAWFKAIYQRNTYFIAILGIFCFLLALDPVLSIGRYVVYFQCIGFLALAYVLSPRYQWILPLLTIAYLTLAGYSLLNPETGIVQRRLAYFAQRQVFLQSIQSQRRQFFDFYYDINAACPGYYWLLRFYQVPVKLVETPPQGDNFFYIHRKEYQQHCEVDTHFLAAIDAQIQQTEQGKTLKLSAKNPAAQENCQLCVSEYGCLYLPFHIYTMTINLSHVFHFQTAGEKQLQLTCRALNGDLTEKTLKWTVEKAL